MTVTAQLARRSRQITKILRVAGPRGIGDAARRGVANWIRPGQEQWPVDRKDVLGANLSAPFKAPDIPVRAGEKLSLNWVMIAPAPGSGGHTTIFRMIRHLQAQGHDNRVYFYDPYGSDHHHHARTVKDYFGFSGPVLPMNKPMLDAHGVIATSWPTAYAVHNARCAGKRFYFVQDFEPYFHAAGAFAALAENTYRMGFHGITAGRWLSEKLEAEFAMPAGHFDLGCDSALYSRATDTERNGVAFYARPGATRRGVETGLLALSIFAPRRPDVPIHLYGATMDDVGFDALDHGLVTPLEINAIYNQCRAALSLSFTNVSLVPLEMLASGCLPIVNDAPHNRLVLDNPFVRYVRPDPHAMADELERITGMANFEPVSEAASQSVGGENWTRAAQQVETILRQALTTRGRARADYAAEC